MREKPNELNDDQAPPTDGRDKEDHAVPATHGDAPTGRPERSLGTGREATEPAESGAEHGHESAYGGKGGTPKKPAP